MKYFLEHYDVEDGSADYGKYSFQMTVAFDVEVE